MVLRLKHLHIDEQMYFVAAGRDNASVDIKNNRFFRAGFDDDLTGLKYGKKVGVAREDIKRAN